MNSQQSRYFTTPIYYANGKAHAGHVYATILVSTLKRHYSHRNFDLRFLTGLDEHGEAVQDKARELGLSPQNLVDKMALEWKSYFAKFNLDYDIFMRTTSKEHIKNVQEILNYCYKKGDIYFGEHEGYYCIKCEGFLNTNERDENNHCIIHKRPTELRKEGNYFFRTSKYRDTLRPLIKNGHITRQDRYVNELLALLDNLEGDLSISRPKSRLEWGIELPFDNAHVAYVWFDALPNYVTGIGGIEAARQSPYWKNAYHLLGKDILKFHGIFWPAMCLSLDIPVPHLLITGWLLTDGHKMSKSLANGLKVEDILHFGRDMFVNYVMRAVNPGEDIEVSWKSYFERFNADLANGLGNLLARTLTMTEKFCQNKIPEFKKEALIEEQIQIADACQNAVNNVSIAFDEFRIADALNEIWQLIAMADKHITQQKPWDLAKKHDSHFQTILNNVIATCLGVLRTVGYLAHAFFPEKMDELLLSLGENISHKHEFFERAHNFYAIRSTHHLNEIPRLYARIDLHEAMAFVNATEINSQKIPSNKKEEKLNQSVQNEIKTIPTGLIQIQDFTKVELHVGYVQSVEFVDGSDKLLRLIVSLGDLGSRQILAGIRVWVRPEDLVHRKVIIVTNLETRKMKFGLSEGMMLATDTIDGQISPVYLPKSLKEGARLS